MLGYSYWLVGGVVSIVLDPPSDGVSGRVDLAALLWLLHLQFCLFGFRTLSCQQWDCPVQRANGPGTDRGAGHVMLSVTNSRNADGRHYSGSTER